MFQQQFNKIKGLLAAITQIKYLEWYFEQDKKQGGIVNTPCVFIDFKPANIKRLNKYTEEVTLPFDVKIYTENLKAREKLGEATNPHFEVESLILEKLKVFEKTGFIPIFKTPSGLMHSVISYQLHFTQGTDLNKAFVKNSVPAVDKIEVST